MDSVVSIPRFPAPHTHLPPKRNSVEKLLYITQRFNEAKYRGFYGICSFCGFSRKGNSSQFRVHFTKESEGGTTCSPCSRVPDAIMNFYIAQRDGFLEKKGARNSKSAMDLQNAMRVDDSMESSPSSSQNSNPKRSRSEDPLQPSILQSMVSSTLHFDVRRLWYQLISILTGCCEDSKTEYGCSTFSC